jgi:hypothetical protein
VLYKQACDRGFEVGCTKLGNAYIGPKVIEYRKSLQSGSDSHCGLVIEVKPPIAKVQTMIGEMWFKIEQIYPKGGAKCRFVNGVYQDPT